MDIKAIAASFSKQFSDFKKQHEKASAMLADVQSKIADLEDEASGLKSAPLNCADFAAYLVDVVEEFAATGRDNMRKTIGTAASHMREPRRGPYLTKRALAWETMKTTEARKSLVGNSFTALITGWNPNTGYNFEGQLDAVSICTLFEDVIKASVAKNLAAIAWPYPDAQPVAERERRLAEIEAELGPLRKSEGELVDMLAQMAVLKDPEAP